MTIQRNALALAAVLVGVAMLSRKASAAETGDDLLQEIEVTARRIGEDGGRIFEELFASDEPLGMRNNNPMNVRETAITWQGELPHDGDGYEDFETAADGIRAGARVLLNYYREHGIRTLQGIVMRYAPPGDNNPTAAYVDFMVRRMGVAGNAALNMESLDTIAQLCEAIIEFENGQQPYTRAYIRAAAKRAF